MIATAKGGASLHALELLRTAFAWENHGRIPLRPQDERFMPPLRRWLLARPDDYVLIDTLAGIEGVRSTGRLAVSLDIEGANAVPTIVEAMLACGYGAEAVRAILGGNLLRVARQCWNNG